MSRKRYYLPGVDEIHQLEETPASKAITERNRFIITVVVSAAERRLTESNKLIRFGFCGYACHHTRKSFLNFHFFTSFFVAYNLRFHKSMSKKIK